MALQIDMVNLIKGECMKSRNKREGKYIPGKHIGNLPSGKAINVRTGEGNGISRNETLSAGVFYGVTKIKGIVK